MSHLLPELPAGPVHRMTDAVVADHMTPVAHPAFRAIQLLQPFVAQHQDGVGLEDLAGLLLGDTPLQQLLHALEVQVVLAAVALDALLGTGRAEQLPAPGAAPGEQTVGSTDTAQGERRSTEVGKGL